MANEILLNRYKVIEKLGEGGMGIVWKVFDDTEKKEVALKEIKLKADDEGSSKGSRVLMTPTDLMSSGSDLRFSEEFRTMTKLQYPFTIKVFDYGTLENGNRYITMEVLDGALLKDAITKKKFEFQEIYKILIQLAQTLNFIHSRLYIHRDIKPENIFLTKDGNIKLMDFGLMDRLGVVSDGKMTGTVSYVPPEVFKGGVINESSDLYSLGILGYELATGHVPFQSDDVLEIIRKHIKEAPASLVSARTDAPVEFEGIIFKLLQKDQNNRYQNASELLEDLSKLSTEQVSFETLDQKKSYLYCHELIGREKEADQLKNIFEKLKEGVGYSAFITAPAGVGKTRLIEEIKLEAKLSGINFIEGFCSEQGMALYQPFKQVLKAVIPLVKKETLNKFGHVLAKVLPELMKKGFTPEQNSDEMTEKMHIMESVVGFLKDVCETNSLVICIEDIHWIDSASLDLLNACIRELNGEKVSFISTFRDDEAEEMSPIFHTMEEGISIAIKLSPLTKENVQLLIEKMLGQIQLNDEFIDQIFKVTGGNPFFVTETMRILIEDGKIKMGHKVWIVPEDIVELELPVSIEATIISRIKHLSNAALSLLQISSVIGKELELPFLKDMSGLEDTQLFDTLDELVENQYLKKEKEKYVFNHDRVRETLYKQLDDDLRHMLHEKAANILESKNLKRIKSVVHLLAYHFSAGQDKQKAVKYLLMAGDDSEHNASYADFNQKYIDALSILETIDYPDKEKVLFEARSKVMKVSYTFAPELAINIYKKILPDIYKLAGGEDSLKKKAKSFQSIYKIINKLPPKFAEKVKAGLSKEYPPYSMPKNKDYPHIISKLVEFSLFYGIAKYIQSDYRTVVGMVDYLADNILPEAQGSLDYACVLPARTGALLATQRYVQAKKEMKDAISVIEKYLSKLNKQQMIIYTAAWFWHNDAAMLLGNLSNDQINKHLKIAKENAIYDQIGWCYLNQYGALAFKGHYPESEIVLDKWTDITKKLGYPRAMVYWNCIYRAIFAIDRGELDLVEMLLDKAKKYQLSETGMDLSYYKLYSGILLLRRGKIEKSIDMLLDCIDFCSKNNLMKLLEAKSYLAEVYINSDRLEEAASLLNESLEKASDEEYYNPFCQTLAYRLKGELFIKKKDFQGAMENLNSSIKCAQDIGATLSLGQAYLSLGRLLMELTQYIKAKETLSLAIKAFNEIKNDFELKKANDLMELLDSKNK